MLAKTRGFVITGLDGREVDVEVDTNLGLPGFEIVGLPDAAVKESKERVLSAIKNSGRKFPIHKITVNLAPAELKKEGAGLDLPIAVGIIAANGQLASADVKAAMIGELSLDGKGRERNSADSYFRARKRRRGNDNPRGKLGRGQFYRRDNR